MVVVVAGIAVCRDHHFKLISPQPLSKLDADLMRDFCRHFIRSK